MKKLLKDCDNWRIMEQIAKCAIGWNQKGQGYMEFDKKFLSYYNKFEIVVVEETNETIKVKIEPKRS